MKKITLLMLFLSTFLGYSQVSNYTFSQSNGTYSEITAPAGNLLGSPSIDNQVFVDSTAAGAAGGTIKKGLGLPIGFKFRFNNYDYDRFAINTNGWISFGSSALNPNAVDITNNAYTSPISSAYTTTPSPADLTARICPLGGDLLAQAGSTLSYLTTGAKGSRVLVIQWKNFKSSQVAGSFNFQIRLYETLNEVEFIYGAFTNPNTYVSNFEVGLRADTATPPNNYIGRTTKPGLTWSTTTASAIVSAVWTTMEMKSSLVPASGLTYTWTPPACSYPNNLSISVITANSATLAWGSYSPAPAGYEYIVSTSATLPLSTVSGTSTIAPGVTVSSLIPNTAYNVFLRSSCGNNVFTPWILAGNFKTICALFDTFSENFDGYTNLFGNATMPDCWSNGVQGKNFINNSPSSLGSTPNNLELSSGSASTIAYATLPSVTNLQAGINRLRFKAYSLTTGKTLDIGYFDNTGTNFLVLQTVSLPSVPPSTIQEFKVLPGKLPDYAKSLVFRNNIVGSTVFIDDVFWEFNPPCENVKSIAVTKVLNNSVNLSWDVTGTETQWQYAYAPSSVTDLTTLTPVAVTSKTQLVTGLMPSTSYKIYVRSNCDVDKYGVWIPSDTFTTTCDPVSTLNENFDSAVAFPGCWSKVGAAGTAVVMNMGTPAAASSPNALRISSYLPTNRAVVTMPPLSNATTGSNRLRFKCIGDAVGAKLEIGYLTEAANDATFVPVWNYTVASTTTYADVIVALGTTPTTPYLAFRNSGEVSGGSTIYVDNVIWEPTPTCPDVSAISTSGVSDSSVNVSWTGSGTENMWQYALGAASVTDPNSVTAVDVNSSSITIQQGMSPSTSYKIWIRSKCSNTSLGAWWGPFLITTTCAPVTDFIQNFDNSTNFPVCWSKVGTQGTAVVMASTGSNTTNVLKLEGNTAAQAVVAMPPVSNSGDSTHRLRFKLSGSVSGASVEVGYLVNYLDPSSFIKLQSFTVNSDLSYSNVIADLGYDPASQVLAFRNPGIAHDVNFPDVTAAIFVDEVVWEPVPACVNISNLGTKSIRGTSIDIKWTAGGTEAKWQYVLGNSTALDPNVLTPVDVSSTVATINNLMPLTTYKVWVRSKCNSVSLGVWIGPVVFTTTCAAVTDFNQNFDAINALPSCWNDVNGKGDVSVASLAGTSSPNVLKLNGTDAGALAAMQPVSNAAAGTQRLKFKFRGSTVGADLQVGYMTNVSDPNSFVLLQGFQASSTSSYDRKIITSGNTPQSEVLAFRNPAGSTSTIYIDDVVWEAIPACSDVSTLKEFAVTSNSVGISWIADGSENTAQYVIAPSSVTDPNSLNPVDVNASVMTIGNLLPSTSYKVWMRSKCNSTSVGYWSDPLVFSTTCAPVAEFTQNFDSGTTLPSCWNQIGGQGVVSIINLGGASAPNVLKMNSTASTLPVVVAMPPVSNSGNGTHRLKFKLAGNAVGTIAEVGYLTNMTDANSFVPVKSFTASSNNVFDNIVADLGSNPTTQFLAFRNTGSISCSVFIDDVVWEVTPPCADVSNIISTGVTGNSVNLKWNPGGSESAWQYALGDSTSKDPSLLNPVDVNSSAATVNNLLPATSYKIWIRSKCGTVGVGDWIGPLSFTTTCSTVSDFTENFDATNALPTCWAKVGSNGTVSVAPATGTGYSNVLTMSSNGTTDPVIVAMLPVDNAGAGTHRLRFKLSGSIAGAVTEVGYLTNVADASSFVKLKTFTVNSANVYENEVATLGVDPTSQILAFRNPGIASSSTSIYIDNLIWEVIPACPDVNSLATKSISATSVDLTWVSTGTKWQYALGSANATNPDTLDHIDVASSSVTIAGLVSSTGYKVWVRSKCSDTSFGLWTTDPLAFTTTCSPVSEFNQNFDASTALPTCWTKIGAPAIFPVLAMAGPSSPNVLYIKNVSVGEQVIVSMPPVSNASDGTHRLRFRLGGYAVGNAVELGYMTNVSDPASFVSLKSYTVSSASQYDSEIAELGTTPASPILAFRNASPSGLSSAVYVDDVIWEPVPSCSQVSALAYTTVTSNSASINWNAGGSETHWQYVVAPATVSYPDASAAVDVNSISIVINNLTANTNYKVWIRSKCDTSLFGSWTAALAFKTTCGPVTGFTENFDSSTNLPSCWSKVGSEGVAAIMPSVSNAPSGSNVLYMSNSSVNVIPVVTLPQLSNAGDGTHRLRFKFMCNIAGSGLQVGYLTNGSDPTSFVLAKTFTSTQANIFETGVLELGANPISQVLVFRFPSNSHYQSVYIDDVTWEVKPVVSVPNDEISNTVTLTVGNSFDSNAVVGTNVTATATNQIVQPGCGGYNGADVWYSAVVPASGNIIFEVANIPGGLTNTSAAVYGDYTTTALYGDYAALIACGDSSGSTGLDHPRISLTGKIPGVVLYLRVWENGADATGSFKVSAYDSTESILGVDPFDAVNFSYYPNPVNDVLNLAFNQDINNVTVVNLLGQEVISKSVNANQTKIDMSGLSKGAYLVKVISANQSKTIKVMKE